MMRLRGGGRHHPGCSTYQPAMVPRGVLTSGRASVVAPRERRAVVRRPAGCQRYPTTISCQVSHRRSAVAAAATVVDGTRACLQRTTDGFGAHPVGAAVDGTRACLQQRTADGGLEVRPAAAGGGEVAALLAEQLEDAKRKARKEREYLERRVSEMQGAVLVYHRRAEEAERGLKLVTVSRACVFSRRVLCRIFPQDLCHCCCHGESSRLYQCIYAICRIGYVGAAAAAATAAAAGELH